MDPLNINQEPQINNTVDEVLNEFPYKPMDLYDQLRHCCQIETHACGKYRNGLFTRYITEDETSLDFRIRNFIPITHAIWSAGVNNIFKIMQDSQYNVKISDSLNSYINEKRFDGDDFYAFFMTRVIPFTIAHPNGFLVTLPYPMSETEPVEIDLKLVREDQIYYSSVDILIFADKPIHNYKDIKNRHLEYITNKDLLKQNFYVLTSESFYLLEYFNQPGDGKDKNERLSYERTKVYDHNLGFIPAVQSGGKWDYDMWRSYFDHALILMDETLRSYSDHKVVNASSSYPIRQMREIPCTAEGCNRGMIEYMDGNTPRSRKCGTCNGTGMHQYTSPFRVLIKPNTGMGEQIDSTPMLQYISPDVSILEYNKKLVDADVYRCEKALFINRAEMMQSGVAKVVDKENLYSFLSHFGQRFFDVIMLNTLRNIELLREIVSPQMPVVIRPNSYSIYTDEEILAQIGQTDNDYIKTKLMDDLINKRFGGDLTIQKFWEVSKLLDPLAVMDNMTIQSLVSAMIYTPEQATRHFNLQHVYQLVAADYDPYMHYLTITQLAEICNQYYKNTYGMIEEQAAEAAAAEEENSAEAEESPEDNTEDQAES